MSDSSPHLPLRDLEALLGTALGAADVHVAGRERNPYSSRFNSEIVELEGNGTRRRVFCKYGLPGGIVDVHGLRSGIRYEADVYEAVVASSTGRRAGCLGYAADPSTGLEMLVLEYLEGYNRIAKYKPLSLPSAAAWIGGFHARHEGQRVPGLNRYDRDFYLGWATRASEWSVDPSSPPDRLERVLELYAAAVTTLEQAPLTVIHGEFYPNNVLIDDADVCPVDWEWAAVAAGEIDLAALTEGAWGRGLVEACVAAYCDARWSGSVPSGFERRMAAARAYLHMRSLGGRPERANTESTGWRWESLEQLVSEWDPSRPKTEPCS